MSTEAGWHTRVHLLTILSFKTCTKQHFGATIPLFDCPVYWKNQTAKFLYTLLSEKIGITEVNKASLIDLRSTSFYFEVCKCCDRNSRNAFPPRVSFASHKNPLCHEWEQLMYKKCRCTLITSAPVGDVASTQRKRTTWFHIVHLNSKSSNSQLIFSLIVDIVYVTSKITPHTNKR